MQIGAAQAHPSSNKPHQTYTWGRKPWVYGFRCFCSQHRHGHAVNIGTGTHLNDNLVLLRAERLPFQGGAELIEPPANQYQVFNLKTRLIVGFPGLRTMYDRKMGRYARSSEAISNPLCFEKQCLGAYLSLQLLPVRPPPNRFATALHEKPVPLVPPSSLMTFCKRRSSCNTIESHRLEQIRFFVGSIVCPGSIPAPAQALSASRGPGDQLTTTAAAKTAAQLVKLTLTAICIDAPRLTSGFHVVPLHSAVSSNIFVWLCLGARSLPFG